jgi:hypothetical protein
MLAIGCGAAPVIDPPIVDTSRTGAAVTWSADAQQVVAEAHVEFALRISGLSIQIVTDIEIDTAAGIYRVTIAIPFFDPIVVELPIEPPPPPADM